MLVPPNMFQPTTRINLILFVCLKQIHLKPGSQLRAPYTKAPFGIDFRVYMFNLTNLDEVHAGKIDLN